MFNHIVLFWLKSNLSAEEIERFDRGIKSLTTIPSLQHAWAGTPADTRRPVIDHSYSYGLNAVFASRADHDAYQVDPIHKRFLEECSTLWERVQIFDFV